MFFLLFSEGAPHGVGAMTWATRITIFRIVLIPIFVWLMVEYGASAAAGQTEDGWRYGAIAVFILASLSDALDGYLARHWNQRSALGALLDPVADKLLLLAVLVTFGILPPRYFPLWFTVIILSRDALLLLGYFVLRHFRHHIEIKPHWSGKLSTFLVFLAIGAVLLQSRPWTIGFCAGGAFFALISTAIYVKRGLEILREAGHTAPAPR
jgi:CDP-diacylglycerol--glycerol-3-phosphate 3-phosphatidyltransferase/cardiolipin synthase